MSSTTINPKHPQYAVDVLLSLAQRLPKNLILDGSTSFPLKFLASLSDELLEKLIKEAQKKDDFRAVYLDFYTKDEGDSGCANNFDLNSFDLSTVKEVKINGDTADYLYYFDQGGFQYIQVILLT